MQEKFKDIVISYLLEIKNLCEDSSDDIKELSLRTPLENFLNKLTNYYSLNNHVIIKHEDRAINTEYGDATPDFAIKRKLDSAINSSRVSGSTSTKERSSVNSKDTSVNVINNKILSDSIITSLASTSAGDTIPNYQQGSFSIGYIETKKPNVSLKYVEELPQIKKYLSITDNLLVSNYFNFKFFSQKENKLEKEEIIFGSYNTIFEPELRHESHDKVFSKLEVLFRDFFNKPIKKIATPKQLALRLANISKLLKEYLLEELNKQTDKEVGELFQIYATFKGNLSELMDREEFIDAFAQMIAYAVFLAKLNTKGDESLSVNNIKAHINTNFSLIGELIKYLDLLTNPKKEISFKCSWLLEELLFVVNNIDMYSVGEYLSYNKKRQKKNDPYLYFYEDFLQQYDKGLRVDRGVYYTPPEVVQYIVKSTSEILKEEFNLSDGFADNNVKVLDFATGTGTFLLDVYKEILDELPNNSAKTEAIIREIILKNIYGFEYLVAPYAVAHLKLSEYIKSKGYVMNVHERIQVYLTNTLSQLHPQANLLLPELSAEGEKAHEIKESEDIMVVLGNPPYNSKSKNPTVGKDGKENFIGSLMKEYKPNDEKNIVSLDDDYIKFIRFAHNKLSNQSKGILAVVVNNSFINGLIHRKMRNSLLKEFSSIYILNLHGDTRKKETTPSGEKDENVFNIMQGVAIAIFVKNGKKNKQLPHSINASTDFDLNKGEKNQQIKLADVYYQDLWGLREEKYNFLANNNYTTTDWIKLDIAGFNQEFNKSLWAKQKEEISKQPKIAKKASKEGLFSQEELEEGNILNNQPLNYIEKNRFTDDLSFFVPISKDGMLAYSNSIGINEIFVEYSLGVESQKDNIAIRFSQSEMLEVITNLKSLDDKTLRSKYSHNNKLLEDGRDWKLKRAISGVLKEEGNIQKITYRVFDSRYTYYTNKNCVIAFPRYDVLQHLLVNNNMGFCFIRHQNTNLYNHFLVTDKISCRDMINSKTYITPVYLTENQTLKYTKSNTKNTETFGYKKEFWISKDNFSSYFKDFIKQKYDLDISYNSNNSLDNTQTNNNLNSTLNSDNLTSTPNNTPTATATLTSTSTNTTYHGNDQFYENNPNKENIELVCGYIYAIMYSKPYKEKYLEYLKIDFPRIIFVDNKKQFLELAKLGKALMQTHLEVKLSKVVLSNLIKEGIFTKEEIQDLEQSKSEFLYEFKDNTDNILRKVNFDSQKNRLYINQSAYFSNVSQEIFDYSIEGKILDRYLKARKDRELSLEEITHLENTIQVLKLTIMIEEKISTLSDKL